MKALGTGEAHVVTAPLWPGPSLCLGLGLITLGCTGRGGVSGGKLGSSVGARPLQVRDVALLRSDVGWAVAFTVTNPNRRLGLYWVPFAITAKDKGGKILGTNRGGLPGAPVTPYTFSSRGKRGRM